MIRHALSSATDNLYPTPSCHMGAFLFTPLEVQCSIYSIA